MAIRIVGVDLPQNKRGEIAFIRSNCSAFAFSTASIPSIARWRL